MIRGLWDSYEDDAFPADVERGVFLYPAKLHALNHVGENFTVAGPLNLSRSPQGQPVIFQAGVSEDGRNLAAHVAEGSYAPGGSLAETQAYYADIKQRTAAAGRNPDHVLIFLGPSDDLERFVSDVVPLLRERGLFRTEYEADTLRGNLGLPIPANRHTLARGLVSAEA